MNPLFHLYVKGLLDDLVETHYADLVNEGVCLQTAQKLANEVKEVSSLTGEDILSVCQQIFDICMCRAEKENIKILFLDENPQQVEI